MSEGGSRFVVPAVVSLLIVVIYAFLVMSVGGPVETGEVVVVDEGIVEEPAEGGECGSPDECFALGQELCGGWCEGEAREEAREAYGKACDGRIAEACVILGRWAWEEEPDERGSRGYFERACWEDHPVGCFLAGKTLLWSGYDARWLVGGRTFYEKACLGGYGGGCCALYELYVRHPLLDPEKDNEMFREVMLRARDPVITDAGIDYESYWYTVAKGKKAGRRTVACEDVAGLDEFTDGTVMVATSITFGGDEYIDEIRFADMQDAEVFVSIVDVRRSLERPKLGWKEIVEKVCKAGCEESCEALGEDGE